MRYEFYYKIKDSTEKLVSFIKCHCLNCCDVYFDDFESNKIFYILSEISDVIEVNYPPICCDGPYQMFKRQIRTRGK